MLIMRHALKTHHLIVVIVAQSVHEVRACNSDPDYCDLHAFLPLILLKKKP